MAARGAAGPAILASGMTVALNLIAHRGVEGPADAWEERRRVPLINHVRIPAFLAALALLMFFPLILGLDSANYEKDTGLSGDVFLTRWLGLCAALFLGSALIYAVRLRRAGRGGEPADPPAPHPEGT